MPNANIRATRASFLDDLAKRLRSVRLDALPDILAAIDRATVSGPAQKGRSSQPLDLDALARHIVALPVKGSKLDAVQAAVVRHALETCNGNISAASRLLGVDRNAFKRREARARKRARRG